MTERIPPGDFRLPPVRSLTDRYPHLAGTKERADFRGSAPAQPVDARAQMDATARGKNNHVERQTFTQADVDRAGLTAAAAAQGPSRAVSAESVMALRVELQSLSDLVKRLHADSGPPADLIATLQDHGEELLWLRAEVQSLRDEVNTIAGNSP
jgi:hypothetical protein